MAQQNYFQICIYLIVGNFSKIIFFMYHECVIYILFYTLKKILIIIGPMKRSLITIQLNIVNTLNNWIHLYITYSFLQ